jgi:hypothetical protein
VKALKSEAAIYTKFFSESVLQNIKQADSFLEYEYRKIDKNGG